MPMREPLLGKTPAELKEVALKVGLPAFAGKQLAGWLYGRRARSFEEMLHPHARFPEMGPRSIFSLSVGETLLRR